MNHNWPHPTIDEFHQIIENLNKEIAALKKEVYEYRYCILRHNVGSHCQKLNDEESRAKRDLYEEKLTNFNKKMGAPAPKLDYGPDDRHSEYFFVIEGIEQMERDQLMYDTISHQRKADGLEDDGVYIFEDGIPTEHIKAKQ